MNNWIPCSEMLPDLGQQVLTFRPDTNHFYPGANDPVHICLAYRMKYGGYLSRGWYWQEFGSMTYRMGEMTHWHPVPEIPLLTVQTIQKTIVDYLSGDITLGDLQDWLAPHAWDIDDDTDPLVSELIYSIELTISEYTAGHRTSDNFTSELRKLCD